MAAQRCGKRRRETTTGIRGRARDVPARAPGQLRVVRPAGAAPGPRLHVPVPGPAQPRAVVRHAGGHAVDAGVLRVGGGARGAPRALGRAVRVRGPQHGRPDRQAVRRPVPGARAQARHAGHRGAHGERPGRSGAVRPAGRRQAAETRGPDDVGGRTRHAEGIHARAGPGPDPAPDVQPSIAAGRRDDVLAIRAARARRGPVPVGQRRAARRAVQRVVLGRAAPERGGQHPVPGAVDARDRQRRVLRRLSLDSAPVRGAAEFPDRPRARRPRRPHEPSAPGGVRHQRVSA